MHHGVLLDVTPWHIVKLHHMVDYNHSGSMHHFDAIACLWPKGQFVQIDPGNC